MKPNIDFKSNERGQLPLGVSVVIPCLNEAATIDAAIREAFTGIARSGLPGEVIVVDNGSSDGSQEIAKKAGARLILESNKGYGAALNAGMKAASFSYTVFADADLSYPFESLGDLVAPLLEDKADFVLGTRLKGRIEPGAMPTLNRYLGTPVLSGILSFFYGLKTSDCNSGMRALKTDSYSDLNLQSPGMEYASEMLIRVSLGRLRYHEVPICYRRDGRGKPPHLRRFRDGIRHLRILARYSPSLRWTSMGALGISASALFFGIVSSI